MRPAIRTTVFLLASACASDRAAPTPRGQSPAVSTTILPGPENGSEAFEPHTTIDPANPDRLTVAAMYGNSRARGGRAIWVWHTEDGGRSWTDGRMTPPLVAGKPAGWAADVVAGTTPDGTTVLTSMGGAAAPRTDGLGGIVVSRRSQGDSAFAPPVMVMADRRIGSAHRAISYDKPWMTIDNQQSSPYRGTVYVVSGVLDFELPTRSWAETPPDINRIIMLGLDLAVSRDGGRTFGPARRVADSVFGSDMTVSPSGALEIVYPGPGSLGGASAIMHLRSTDGGSSFERQVAVVTGGDSTTVGGPVLAARPNGDLMACWSERRSSGGQDGTSRLRCAVRRSGGDWTVTGFGVPVPPGTTSNFPSLVGATKGWYLLLYLIDTDRTEVAVFQSTGQADFTKLVTLATTEGLGPSRWCFGRACKFAGKALFGPGDYMSLAAGGGRLAAAYVLPRSGRPLAGSAAVHLSVLSEP